MDIKRLHYYSGIILSVFVGLHLCNHAWGYFGAEAHIAMMNTLRVVYRNVVVETILLGALAVQIGSGLKLARGVGKSSLKGFEKLQVWTGIYLAVFFVLHLGAVLGGRYLLKLDTNYYFGVAGLNTFPFNLYFIPYYGLAVFSFFGHVAAIHHKRMKSNWVGLSPNTQAQLIVAFGIVFVLFLYYSLTNQLAGITLPAEYNVLILK